MEDHKVQIIAESVEEFQKIEKILEKIPRAVYYQITTAKHNALLHCLECEFYLKYDIEQRFALPKETTQIQHFKDFIGIYTPLVFYKISETKIQQLDKYKLSYIFVNEDSIIS